MCGCMSCPLRAIFPVLLRGTFAVPRPSSISFCAPGALWPDRSALAARTFAVPFETALAARGLPDAFRAIEFLHRPEACAGRTMHRRLVAKSLMVAKSIRCVLRHIPLGKAGD